MNDSDVLIQTTESRKYFRAYRLGSFQTDSLVTFVTRVDRVGVLTAKDNGTEIGMRTSNAVRKIRSGAVFVEFAHMPDRRIRVTARPCDRNGRQRARRRFPEKRNSGPDFSLHNFPTTGYRENSGEACVPLWLQT